MTSVKTFPHLYTQEDVATIYVHDRAAETIGRMHSQLNKIRDTFGEHEEYTKAAASLAYVLSRLFQNGFDRESYVTKEMGDDGLSLFVQCGQKFVFGIVWFRNRRDDGTAFEGIAGEWSCHS